MFWHRAFITTRTDDIDEKDFTVGTHDRQPARVVMILTGQGAQWPQMGKSIIDTFPWTRLILEELDRVLQAQRNPPDWSLVSELTEPCSPEHIRQPELSQTNVTALQLCIVAVLERWRIRRSSVVGHLSGEIAAAYTAGLLSQASDIPEDADCRIYQREPRMPFCRNIDPNSTAYDRRRTLPFLV